MKFSNQEQQYLWDLKLISRSNAAMEKLQNIDEEVLTRYRIIQGSLDNDINTRMKSPSVNQGNRIDNWFDLLKDLKAGNKIDETIVKNKLNIAICIEDEEDYSDLFLMLDNPSHQVTVLCFQKIPKNKFSSITVPQNESLPNQIHSSADLVICTNLGLVLECFELEKANVVYWASLRDNYGQIPVFQEVIDKLPVSILCSSAETRDLVKFFPRREVKEIRGSTELDIALKAIGELPAVPCCLTLSEQTLSVCMIVKNEEENLPRCLEHVRKFADEIIIVDTGSEDSTRTIAESYGAKVYTYPWKGDFGAARNESLRYATKEWVLVLDADELVSETYGLVLKQFIQRALGNVYKVSIYNQGNMDIGVLMNQMVRLIRNGQGFYYDGVIHEQLKSINDPLFDIFECPITIHHSGYLQKNVEKQGKKKRNLEIITAFLEKNPEDPFHLFNYGLQLMIEEEWGRALHSFQMSFSYSNPSMMYLPFLISNLVTCLINLKRNQEALQVLIDAERVFPLYPDFPYLKGQIFFTQKRYAEAKKTFKKAISKGEVVTQTTSVYGRGSFLSAYFLARIAQEEKKYQEGIELLEKWMPRAHLPQLKKLWADLAVKTLTLVEIKTHLERGFWQTENVFFELLLFIVAAYLNSYQHEQALEVLEQFPESYKKWEAWLLYRGQVSFRQDNFSEAWGYWNKLTNESMPKVALILAFAHWVEGRKEKADRLSLSVRCLFNGERMVEEEAEFLLRELIWFKDEKMQESLWQYPDQELLARIFLSFEQKNFAFRAFAQGVQQGKGTVEGLKLLGKISEELGLSEDAEVFWTQALARDKEDWEIYSNLLQLYLKDKKRDKALSMVHKRRGVFFPDKLKIH
ncbi:MAG: glycosyltransferase [Desulfitobacteriaceae bacterium]